MQKKDLLVEFNNLPDSLLTWMLCSKGVTVLAGLHLVDCPEVSSVRSSSLRCFLEGTVFVGTNMVSLAVTCLPFSLKTTSGTGVHHKVSSVRRNNLPTVLISVHDDVAAVTIYFTRNSVHKFWLADCGCAFPKT